MSCGGHTVRLKASRLVCKSSLHFEALILCSPHFLGRLLHYLSNALQRTHSLSEDIKPSSNVLTLALLNEQVATIISKHLLGDVGPSQPKTPSQFDFVEWTSAEMLAKDVRLREIKSLLNLINIHA